jgi:hypothetical protein
MYYEGRYMKKMETNSAFIKSVGVLQFSPREKALGPGV